MFINTFVMNSATLTTVFPIYYTLDFPISYILAFPIYYLLAFPIYYLLVYNFPILPQYYVLCSLMITYSVNKEFPYQFPT